MRDPDNREVGSVAWVANRFVVCNLQTLPMCFDERFCQESLCLQSVAQLL